MKNKKGKNTSGRIISLIYFVLFLAIAAFLLFNQSGIIKYYELKSEFKLIQSRITEAKNQIFKLEHELDSLKTELVKVEHVAREKYLMLKPNEKGIKINKD
ncbi:MAG: septum formation initiator family protein [Melioribacteraceae bacterium]|nr:septum formation initiator family protein [Melioribacteraceae bacterium]